MIDPEEERWHDRCLDRAIELDELDAMEGDMAENDRKLADSYEDPDAYYSRLEYEERKRKLAAETPEQRAKRLARQRAADLREQKNQDMGVTSLGDILGAALAKKAGK